MLGPFTFFNAQKTKYLQILTSLMRWLGKNLVSPLMFDRRSSFFKQDCSLPFIHLCLGSLFTLLLLSYPPCPSPPPTPRPSRVAAGPGPSIMVWSCSVPLIPVSSHSSA